jgi:hypothetical protein
MKHVIVAAVLLVSTGCTGHMNSSEPDRSTDVAHAMDTLGTARIFFAHQSVGGNIVDGMQRLKADGKGAQLRIVELKDPNQMGDAVFAHARLGRNGDPKGKTDAFAAALRGGLANQVDVAFQKYCYVDIDASTDVDALFKYYKGTMQQLHAEFPHLRLVHVTAPLVRVQSGPKAVIKKLLGRTPDFYDDNAARERYNALMRKEYGGDLFDLAALEASKPGAAPEPFQFHGMNLLELRPEYTSDGAHLNEPASKRIAGELMVFLNRARHAQAGP